MRRSMLPGPVAGSLVGAMLTAALLAVFYAGWRLAGLPFIPFDLFDWTARILPGRFIEFVISAMVSLIRGLQLGPTADVAKQMEQAIGLGMLFGAGVFAGVLIFSILRFLNGRKSYPLGLALGFIAGIPGLLISSTLGQTGRTPPVVGGLWVLAVFLLWGLALGWAYQRLLAASGPSELVSVTKESVERLDRRHFLIRLAGYTAVITVSGAVVGMLAERFRSSRVRLSELWSAKNSLPNADAAVKPVPGTRPEFTPLDRHYRIDINTVPPSINEQIWRLKIGGLIDKPVLLTLDQIRSYEPTHQFITLSCISNPVGGDLIGTTRWTGVSVKKLLPDLHLKPQATHLKVRSADGFWEIVPVDTINADERVMLTYAWDGVPLLPEHGFPLRIYIPDLYGMKQPKWIESIEAIDHWEPGYWVVRGWDKTARMKATSVIDTVAVNMNIINADKETIVPVGGIAHAGARRISKVEVRVDSGPWQPAALRKPLSHLTWVLWRYDWRFRPGSHTFTVRCYDGKGSPQIIEAMPPYPSGASGLFSKTQKL